MDERLIPAPLRRWIVDIASRGGFPLEYPAAAAIVGLSGLIGRRIAMRPKRADDWLVVANLWARSSDRPAFRRRPRSRRLYGRCADWLLTHGMARSRRSRRSRGTGWSIEARQEAAKLALAKPPDKESRTKTSFGSPPMPGQGLTLVDQHQRYLVYERDRREARRAAGRERERADAFSRRARSAFCADGSARTRIGPRVLPGSLEWLEFLRL